MQRVFALLLLLVTVACTQPAVTPADAQVSVGINAPGISIGINLPIFPELVVVPGYPVYYAPSMNANYFFYDGFYWVFNVEDGQWYSSSWYNGPWVFVEPWYVPQPVLVIPFRYYRVRPVYWGGWAYDAPPRWGHHWGRDWEARRAGWDRWDRSRAIAPAPLPLYQREYTRDRYPAPAQQVSIHNEHYKYQTKDTHVQQQRAAIFRQQASGGTKANVKAERAAEQARERPQRQEAAPPPARSRQEIAPRQEGPAVERGQSERGRRPEQQRVEPQRNAPREQAAPEQAPRRERQPANQEIGQPPAAPREGRPEQQRVEPQPRAPKGEQAAPQQAPRGERHPAQQPAEQPAVQQPAVQQPPGQSPREERREERQQERGPQGRSDEGPGQGRR